jgi:uncharacterized protein YciI
MKYVLFYDSADDFLSKAPAHFPAHSARLQDFHARGDLLMVGTCDDPRAKARCRSSPAAKPPRSRQGRPFALNGLVRDWYIREWNEVLAP